MTDTPINDGGPAFPLFQHDDSGLTKRDWFAGMARVEDFVLSIMQKYDPFRAWEKLDGYFFCPQTTWEKMTFSQQFHSAVAYHKSAASDAMLAERERR
jgi:hypothetical protein